MAPEEILHMTIDSLIKTNEQQARQIEEMSVRIKELTAQLAWFQRRMFGRSSEKRMMLDGQLTLFDNTEECPSSTSMEEDGTGEKNETCRHITPGPAQKQRKLGESSRDGNSRP